MWKMHPVFHASFLSTCQETPEHGLNFLFPPLSIIHGEGKYTMESIIDHWGSTSCWQFKVQWKGYSPLEDTWEPLAHLSHTKYLVHIYKACQKDVFATPDSPWPMTTMQLELSPTEMVFVLTLACLFLISQLCLPSHLMVVSFFLLSHQQEFLFAWPSSICHPDWQYSINQWENTRWGNSSNA